MRHWKKAAILLLAFLAIIIRADDNTVTIVDGTTANIGSFAPSGTNNLLLVTNAGSAFVSEFAKLKTSQSNALVVAGAGSYISNNLTVGGGFSNTLQFLDGGFIKGRVSFSGTNNLLLFQNTALTNVRFGVSGRSNIIQARRTTFINGGPGFTAPQFTYFDFSESQMTYQDLNFEGARSNRFVLRDGSFCTGENSHLAGYQNRWEITGPGTILSNTFIFSLHCDAKLNPGNVFTVSDGATLYQDFWLEVGASSQFNEFKLDGPGTAVHARSLVELSGNSNSIAVLNGAAMRSASNVTTSGFANRITVAGDGSAWINAATMEAAGISNRLAISDLATVSTRQFLNSGKSNIVEIDAQSTLDVEADFVSDGSSRISGAGEVATGRLILNGGAAHALEIAGVHWTARTNIFAPGSSNRVSIIDRAVIDTSLMVLGTNSAGSDKGTNNQILISGIGTAVNADSLRIDSRWQDLRVADGARLTTDSLVDLRGRFNVEISGAGAVWTNRGDFQTGSQQANDAFLIARGGVLATKNAAIGNVEPNPAVFAFIPTPLNNTLTLEGPGARWDVDGGLVIGRYGNSNVVSVRNGAILQAASVTNGFYDWDSVAISLRNHGGQNRLNIEGPGAELRVANDIEMGWRTIGNSLRIADGAHATARNLRIGHREIRDNFTSSLISSLEISGADTVLYLTGTFAAASDISMLVGPGARFTAAGGQLNGDVAIQGEATFGGPTRYPWTNLLVSSGGQLSTGPLDLTAGFAHGRLTVSGSGSHLNTDTITLQTFFSEQQAPGDFALRAENFGRVNTRQILIDRGPRDGTNSITVATGAAVEIYDLKEGGLLAMENGRVSVEGGSLLMARLRMAGDGTFLSATNTIFIGYADTIGEGNIRIWNSAFLRGAIACKNFLAENGKLSIHQKASLAPSETARFESQAKVELIVASATNAAPIQTPSITLGGTLAITLAPGFDLHEGDSIAFISSPAIAGQFANAPSGTRLATTDLQGSFIVQVNASSVTLADFRILPPGPRIHVSFDKANGQISLNFDTATKVQTSTNLLDWIEAATFAEGETNWNSAINFAEPRRYFRLAR